MSRPKRHPSFPYVGLAQYFLTFCVDQRRTIFVSAVCVNDALTQIRQAASNEGFAIFLYCFMPDHLHLLVEAGHESADMRRFAQVAKRRSGSVYARTAKHRLWQGGYYDHVVRGSEDAKRVARYILQNPVRAGLVKSPIEYEFLGSDLWSVEELIRWCE